MRILGDERRRRAARERVLDEVRAVPDCDEQVALLDAPRVDLDTRHRVRPRPRHEPSERLDLRQLDRDHAEQLQRDGAIVEGNAPVGELHLRVRALARDHDDVARRRSGERGLDRVTAVEHDLESSLCDLCGDRPRVLRARVVGRDDRTIGERRGDAAHQRALLAVAVAAGAEDDDHTTAELARRLQDVLERIRRVRVVDDHRKRLARVDRLEAAGDTGNRLDARADRSLVDPELASGPDRAERVGAVEPTPQPKVEVRQVVVGRERPRARKLGGEASTPFVANVHDRMLRLVEQRALRGEVRLHRPVEVEMVLREVREDEHREPRAGEPPLLRGDRRRLHRTRAVARVEHLAEEPLQVDRLGRVQTGLARLAADAALDVRQQRRAARRRVEDRRQQERRRRLPVRARHRGDVEFARRVAEEQRRRDGHRLAHARDDELRRVEVEPRSTTSPTAPAASGVPSEIVPVDGWRRGCRRRASPSRTARVS